jgi:hypothetical protein
MKNYVPFKLLLVFLIIIVLFMFLDTPIKENYFDGCGCDCKCNNNTPSKSFIVVAWDWLFSSRKNSCDADNHADECPCGTMVRGGLKNVPAPSAPPVVAAPSTQSPYALASQYCAAAAKAAQEANTSLNPGVVVYCSSWAASVANPIIAASAGAAPAALISGRCGLTGSSCNDGKNVCAPNDVCYTGHCSSSGSICNTTADCITEGEQCLIP